MIELKLTKDNNSCDSCDAINYNPSFWHSAKMVKRLYKLRIGYIVLCLCEDCLKELTLSIDEQKEKGGAE